MTKTYCDLCGKEAESLKEIQLADDSPIEVCVNCFQHARIHFVVLKERYQCRKKEADNEVS